MRTEDFENAIDALRCSIMIDEMKIRKNNVYLCTGYTENKYLQWDEFGRAYGCELCEDDEPPHPLVRLSEFDLKFE